MLTRWVGVAKCWREHNKSELFSKNFMRIFFFVVIHRYNKICWLWTFDGNCFSLYFYLFHKPHTVDTDSNVKWINKTEIWSLIRPLFHHAYFFWSTKRIIFLYNKVYIFLMDICKVGISNAAILSRPNSATTVSKSSCIQAAGYSHKGWLRNIFRRCLVSGGVLSFQFGAKK